MTQPTQTIPQATATPKKAYQAPQLVEYGAVHQFTQGSAGTMVDGMGGMRARN